MVFWVGDMYRVETKQGVPVIMYNVITFECSKEVIKAWFISLLRTGDISELPRNLLKL